MGAKVEVEVGDPLILLKQSQPVYYNIQVPMGEDYEQQQQPYIVIPVPPSNPHLRICICCLCCCNKQLIRLTLLFLVAACLIVWLLSPSHPHLEVVHVQLDHANISRSSNTIVFLDTSMDLQVMIQNRDFISHTYNLISILVGYQGKWLGSTTTNETFVDARSTSYLEALVKLNGTQTFDEGPSDGEEDDNIDIAQGSIPLEIIIEVGAKFHFFSINVPIQAMTSCIVNVDVGNQTIASQDCYPEVSSRYHATYSSASLKEGDLDMDS